VSLDIKLNTALLALSNIHWFIPFGKIKGSVKFLRSSEVISAGRFTVYVLSAAINSLKIFFCILYEFCGGYFLVGTVIFGKIGNIFPKKEIFSTVFFGHVGFKGSITLWIF